MTTKAMVWIGAATRLLTEQGKRSDFQASVQRTLRYILSARLRDQQYMASPSWKEEELAKAGLKRATFHRVWRWLKDNGLLGWVAWGRQFDFKPTTLKALDTEQGDDKAQYVLTVPVTVDQGDASEPQPDTNNGVSETITPLGETFRSNPLRTRSTTSTDNAPHCLKNTSGGSAAPTSRLLPPLPKVIRGDITAKASKNKREARASQEQFALTLKYLVPALNAPQLTTKKLMWVLRDMGFFAAGWTVNDIIYSLDQPYGGGRWPHDGATGIQNLAGWFRKRMEGWIDENGRPRQSRSQRLKTEKAEAVAAVVVARQRRTEREEARKAGVASGKFAQGIAQLRAVIRGEA